MRSPTNLGPWVCILILLILLGVGYDKLGTRIEEQKKEIQSLKGQVTQLRNEAASAEKVSARLDAIGHTAARGLRLAQDVEQKFKQMEKR